MQEMKTVTSVSGGKTSAYLSANYPSDELIFALVRSDSKDIKFKDPYLRREVEDRIQKPFIATLEDDIIIKTILDLELFLGKKINWVSGDTFDYIIDNKAGILPNMFRRYCTQYLKIEPIFEWWVEKFNMMPVKMNIGFRYNERNRAKNMDSRRNGLGYLEYKYSFKKHEHGSHKGKNKWVNISWQDPQFPLINDMIYKEDVINFWKDKPVSFAIENNCVGCFHRKTTQLKNASIRFPEKFQWFADQEKKGKGVFKKNISYEKIKSLDIQTSLFDEGCDSGFCGF